VDGFIFLVVTVLDCPPEPAYKRQPPETLFRNYFFGANQQESRRARAEKCSTWVFGGYLRQINHQPNNEQSHAGGDGGHIPGQREAPSRRADHAVDPANQGRGREREKAKEFLAELLADGPVDSETVFALAKEQGIAGRTLERAKTEIRRSTSFMLTSPTINCLITMYSSGN
jgi:hypothetical protein